MEELRHSEATPANSEKKYAAENSNTAAVKKFKGSFDGQLGENTV